MLVHGDEAFLVMAFRVAQVEAPAVAHAALAICDMALVEGISWSGEKVSPRVLTPFASGDINSPCATDLSISTD